MNKRPMFPGEAAQWHEALRRLNQPPHPDSRAADRARRGHKLMQFDARDVENCIDPERIVYNTRAALAQPTYARAMPGTLEHDTAERMKAEIVLYEIEAARRI